MLEQGKIMANVNLSDYVKKTSEEIGKMGGDPNIVYNSNISDAMIKCRNIACEYAKIRKNKNPPIPIAVINKASDCESYTQFKFSTDLNTETLKKAINAINENHNVSLTEYESSINVEIYN